MIFQILKVGCHRTCCVVEFTGLNSFTFQQRRGGVRMTSSWRFCYGGWERFVIGIYLGNGLRLWLCKCLSSRDWRRFWLGILNMTLSLFIQLKCEMSPPAHLWPLFLQLELQQLLLERERISITISKTTYLRFIAQGWMDSVENWRGKGGVDLLIICPSSENIILIGYRGFSYICFALPDSECYWFWMNSERTSSRAPMKELQGPRPPPLKISRESHKIRKPALPVPAVPAVPIINGSQPVIIYMHSPKVIHAEVQDFMTLVQRLTGSSSSSDTFACAVKSENLTADHHEYSTIIPQASDVTNSSQPDESADQNMGSPRTDDTPCDFDTTSLKNDRNEEIENYKAPVPSVTPNSSGDSSAPIVIAPYSPFSPNFLFPSQRLLSPSIFQDIPLFTPNSDNFFFSPRHFYRFSEPMFSPPQRQPLNTSTMQLQSPSPTSLDLCKTLPEQ